MRNGINKHSHAVPVGELSIEPVRKLLDAADDAQLTSDIEDARELLAGRTVWNINSTAAGGGVAELLRSLLGYARGVGINARWLVLRGDEAFFRVTKRLHNFLHGDAGDGGELGEAEERAYQATIERNAAEIAPMIRPRDVVVLHDPQTAGLIGPLKARGVVVVWRCHVGAEFVNDYVERGWQFLRPFIAKADGCVFSRRAYVPHDLKGDCVAVIAPSIDPFSPKNQELEPAAIRDALEYVGLIDGDASTASPQFRRFDGSLGRIEHHCEIQSFGPPPGFGVPLVVQVSRWDRLKDPVGVMRSFVEYVAPCVEARLMLAGPMAHSIADDPEGKEVFDEVTAAWQALPEFYRGRVHLACLPMDDIEENAAIVNALQRHAAVVVQKSLQEGFGLTVAEAMWKARPVVASNVGGIQDQMEDGDSGLLLNDPRDYAEFGRLVRQVLTKPDLAAHLGQRAQQRVQKHFLINRQLGQDLRLLQHLLT